MNKLSRLRDRFSNASIRAKLALVFVVTMTLIGFTNVYMYSSMNSMLEEFGQVYESNVSLNTLLSTLEGVQAGMYEYLSTKSSEALSGYYRSLQYYQEQIALLNDIPTDSEQGLAEKNIRRLSQSYMALSSQAVDAKRGLDIEQYRNLYEQAGREYGYLSTLINNLNSAQFSHNSQNYSTMRKTISITQTFSLAALLTAIISNLVALLLITNAMTKPLIKLARQAEQVGRGDFDVKFIDVQTTDEVGTLAAAFRSMIDSLDQYVIKVREQMEKESRMKEDQLRIQNSLREAQLIFLQSQINPHFLYNTLNAGAQLAMMEGAEKTCLFIENLADFFRYNVKRTGEASTLEAEIEQVETYIKIINVRFSGDIKYSKKLDCAVTGVELPGVVLQPIVENAINHGLRDIEGEKRITLGASKAGGYITVTIADNGSGMTDGQLASIFAPSGGDPSARPTGLKNVIERLRIYYHDDRPLSIKSTPGEGTLVSIRIPLKEEQETDV